MNYKITLILFFIFILNNSFSQSISSLRCPFYLDYELDTTFKEDNKWRYLPIKKDSLFLWEYITVSKSKDMMKEKEYERMIESDIKKLGDFWGVFYAEQLSRGNTYNNLFSDFICFTSYTSTELTYQRSLYRKFWKKKNEVYFISYTAVIPSYWQNDEKWRLSIPHFNKKYKDVKLLFNECIL